MGIALPKISRTSLLWLTSILILVPVCLYIIKLNISYQGYYNHYARLSDATYLRFATFTFSTLFGWEFMHRGYLLFGLKELLTQGGTEGSSNQVSKQTASVLAILIVTCFETLYHFLKPDLEAFGMLIGSPFLSLIALKTRSILIPLMIHLYVEVWFIIYVT